MTPPPDERPPSLGASVARFRRLVHLLAPYRVRWLLATGALLLGSAVQLTLPQAARLGIDRALARGDLDALDRIALAAIAAFAVLSGLVFVRHYLMSWLGSRVVADLRDRTFRHLLRQPPGFFHERSSGELVSRLTDDIGTLQGVVGSDISVALRAALTTVGGLCVLAWTSPVLTLVMVGLMPPLSISAVLVGRRIRRRSRQVQDAIANANSRLKEAVVGIETVQVFRAEEREALHYGGRIMVAFRTLLRVALARAGLVAGFMFAGYTSVAVILWIGARMIAHEELSAGELASFVLYTLLVTGALMSLAEIWANLQRALGSTARLFDLLDEDPTIRDAPGAQSLPSVQGVVRFEDVSFAYPGRPDVRVLEGVELTAHPGQMVALVGHSGAGKSTIAALVHRFYDPTGGRISLDGVDLRAVRLADLRAAIGTVHQEPIIFSGTIADNIGYGAPGAGPADIARAARDAYIADFVEGLPEGYDSEVGERGVKLSGGQRQRIAIARALLADPRVLILDEATSHLDTDNEGLVQTALERLMEGRTTLVIAHRLSTVRNADRILVLDGGQIVERGTHEELMRSGPVYRKLTASQTALLADPEPA